MKAAIIGNFAVPYTTETFLARAFTENDWTAAAIPQDNASRMGPAELTALLLTGALAHPRPDLVLYIRSHSATALNQPWTDAWAKLERAGIKTASFHLDRFWDLEREHLIHDHDPLFTVHDVFTADGGNDCRWQAASVNHHWLPPAVDRLEAELQGVVTDGVPDIVFTGSGGRRYHQAYPERVALLDHLNRQYGRRFGHYGHGGNWPVVRQQSLNDVYATAKVVIGDSCFANSPPDATGARKSRYYWSDRVPETLGRGGFLIHPFVEGLRNFYGGAIATYIPGNWDDLDTQIGVWLANDGDRKTMIEAGRRNVLAKHTYTHRIAQLIDTVGLS